MKTIIKSTATSLKTTTVFFMLCILCFTNCKKNDTDTIALGYVYDTYTKKPIKGAQVQLLKLAENSLFDVGTGIRAKTTTNDSGYFFLHSTSGKVDLVSVGDDERDPSNNVYSRVSESISSGSLKNDIRFFITQKVKIQLKIKNVNPYNENDSIAIEMRNGSGYISNIAGYKGGSVNTDCFLTGKGNTTNTFSYFITKNGIETKFEQTIFASTDSACVFEINY